jgi:hypothetical protein
MVKRGAAHARRPERVIQVPCRGRVLLCGPAGRTVARTAPHCNGQAGPDAHRLASAVHGVRSSLSVPLRRGDTVYGSVNFYASSEYAFMGRVRDLAVMVHRCRKRSLTRTCRCCRSAGPGRRSPPSTRGTASTRRPGVLAARHGMTPSEAQQSPVDAATRAGIPIIALARFGAAPPRHISRRPAPILLLAECIRVWLRTTETLQTVCDGDDHGETASLWPLLPAPWGDGR